MYNFLTLYGYELKKILKRKITCFTLIIMVVTAIYIIVWPQLTSTHSWSDEEGNIMSMTHLEYLKSQKAKTEVLNGQAIDDTLLNRVKEVYKNVYREEHYVQTEEGSGYGYRQTIIEIADDEEKSEEEKEASLRNQEIYRPIYDYIKRLTGFYDAVHTIDADTLYQARADNILKPYQAELLLTEKEKEYWTAKDARIQKPFTYGYADGWNEMLYTFTYLNLILLIGISVCLSGMFSEEHQKRTDQLILSSRYGKTRLYFAKIAAGTTFGLSCCVLLFITTLLSCISLYGAEGNNTIIQLYEPLCSRGLTMGQAVFFLGGVFIIISILYSILVMFLSEAAGSGVAVMGIMVSGMFFSILVQVPYRYRITSQIYNLLPTVILNVQQLWDNRLVIVFGMHFTNYQTAIIIFIITGILLILKGGRIYRDHQV